MSPENGEGAPRERLPGDSTNLNRSECSAIGGRGLEWALAQRCSFGRFQGETFATILMSERPDGRDYLGWLVEDGRGRDADIARVIVEAITWSAVDDHMLNLWWRPAA